MQGEFSTKKVKCQKFHEFFSRLNSFRENICEA